MERHRVSRAVCALTAAMVICGCAASDGAPRIVGAIPVVKGRDDPFSPYEEFSTAMLRSGAIPNVTTVRLVGRRDRKSGVATAHARVAIFYEDSVRRHYDTARNARAETMQLSVITRDFPLCGRRPCRYSEEFTVDLPIADLKASGSAGYAFKVFSRVGKEHLVTLPGELVSALLTGMSAAAPASSAKGQKG